MLEWGDPSDVHAGRRRRYGAPTAATAFRKKIYTPPTSETLSAEAKEREELHGAECGQSACFAPLPLLPQSAHSTHWVYLHRLFVRSPAATTPPFRHARTSTAPPHPWLLLSYTLQDFVPRMGYLPAMIAKVMESFRSAVVDGWEEQDVWFDHCGHPLKWYGITGGAGLQLNPRRLCVRPSSRGA